MENPIDSGHSKPRVALIYPPYAPDIVPSLGLGILSTGVKALGFDCTTFYWNLHFRRAIHSRGYRYDPGACLARLDDAGIVYVEDDTYLALPVALHARRVTARWPQEFTTTRLSLPKWMKAVGVLTLGRRSV
jgi:hypothetical protein